jgi:hypothetical protein
MHCEVPACSLSPWSKIRRGGERAGVRVPCSWRESRWGRRPGRRFVRPSWVPVLYDKSRWFCARGSWELSDVGGGTWARRAKPTGVLLVIGETGVRQLSVVSCQWGFHLAADGKKRGGLLGLPDRRPTASRSLNPWLLQFGHRPVATRRDAYAGLPRIAPRRARAVVAARHRSTTSGTISTRKMGRRERESGLLVDGLRPS